MTVTYGFYDSLNGDRKYNAEQMSRMFEGLITDGIFLTVGSALAVSAATGMTINVATGRAWFSKTWTLNDSNLVLNVTASDVALNRIDTVILEVNTDIGVRANAIKMKNGTPGSSPVAPTMTHTSTLNQYPLADIYVGAGVTSINAGNITNRIGSADAPFITGLLQTIDITSLFGQFESDFITWLGTLQDQLDDNQAGNLQVQIDTLDDEVETGWVKVTDTWTYANSAGVTVPSDATLKYSRWMRVRFKQGGGYKYFLARSVASTLITLFAGSDYTVANAAITDVYYSVVNDPYAFPKEFSFVPASNITVGAGTVLAKLIISTSGLVSGHYSLVLAADTVIPTNPNITIPIIPVGYVASANEPIGTCRYKDFNGGSSTAGNLVIATATGVASFGAFNVSGANVLAVGLSATIPFTWAVSDQLQTSFSFFAS